ncbi:MAG: urease accessory protein UreE [Pseudomonadota bacterium]
MKRITEKADHAHDFTLTLTLPFELRQKARLHTTLDNGDEAGLFLKRGDTLRGGDILKADSGENIKVISAKEEVSTVYSSNSLLLTRATYHLGNRHVPVEINSSYIRYCKDHVLDQMIEHLGLTITHELAPFEPESGAYSHGHSHQH